MSQQDQMHLARVVFADLDRREAAMLGHDMRACVADLLAGLRLIERQPRADTLPDQLRGLRSAAEHLARLIAQAGQSPAPDPVPDSVDAPALHLPRFLDDLRKRWQLSAAAQGVRFHLTLSADLPILVTYDQLSLEKILVNLFDNALRFAAQDPAGLVRVSADVHGQNAIEINIQDTGPGFGAAALARLSGPQGNAAETLEPGAGLGLYICHTNARRLGGTLAVTRSDLGGASVTLRLPRAPAASRGST